MWTICSDKLSKLIEYQWKTDGSVSAVDHFYTKNSFIEPLVQSTTYHIARRTDFFFCFPPSNPFVYRYTFVCVCVLVFFLFVRSPSEKCLHLCMTLLSAVAVQKRCKRKLIHHLNFSHTNFVYSRRMCFCLPIAFF